MKTPYELPADIFGLLQKGGHTVDRANLDYYLDTVRDLLLRYLEEVKTVDGVPSFRMSKIGTPDRRLWLEHNTPGYSGEGHSGANILKFLVGSLLEPLLLFLAKEAGHVVTHEQVDCSLEGVNGHPDAVIDGHLVDVKTASPYGYKKFKEAAIFQEDEFGYLYQLAGYNEALGLGTTPLFLAFEKSSCELCVLEVPKHLLPNAAEKIRRAKEVVKLPAPPEELCYQPKPYGKSGNMQIASPCGWCPFKFNCFKDLRVYDYSNGPVFLSSVVNTPLVSEITHRFKKDNK